jgi:hypothetical protein
MNEAASQPDGLDSRMTLGKLLKRLELRRMSTFPLTVGIPNEQVELI